MMHTGGGVSGNLIVNSALERVEDTPCIQHQGCHAIREEVECVGVAEEMAECQKPAKLPDQGLGLNAVLPGCEQEITMPG